MIVKLKVLHGKLQNRRGQSAGLEVSVRGPEFVIGSAPDCSMVCRSRSISGHHCQIRIDEERGPLVRDLYSEGGTFVNDVQVEHEQPLQAGDRLRVGRLEFEVVIDRSEEARAAKEKAAGKSKADPVADYISDLLVEADEEDRARRLEDPESRQFHVSGSDSAEAQDEGAASGEGASEQEAEAKKKVRPPRRPPGKLPPPPPITGESTVEAAEETLKKIFEKEERDKRR
jgi:predicted component of type VI protein secretion system